MKLNYFVLCFFVTLFLFSACNNEKAEREKAQTYIVEIEQLIEEGKYNTAKIELDSLHLQYPKLIDIRKRAIALEDTILKRESNRTIQFCDSVLAIKQHEVDSLISFFRFEKNETYQTIGNYVYRLQNTSNPERTFLRTYVDENADFYLVSNYCGSEISHTSVTVTSGEVFAETSEISTENAANHSFNNDGKHWEIVTFKNDESAKVGAFITQFAYQLVRVTLNGSKKHVYQLPDNDKKTIATTYNFWIAMKDVKQLKEEKAKALAKIENVKTRDQKRQPEEMNEKDK